jgi:hypothetical protein
MKDAWNGLKNTTSGIINYTSDSFNKIGDVTNDLWDFAGDTGQDLATVVKSVAKDPNLANAIDTGQDFLNNAWNITSNLYQNISTIDADTVKGNIKSGLSSTWSSIKSVANSAWDWSSTTLGKGIDALAKLVGGENTIIGKTIKSVGEIITSALIYKDGVTETRYGLAMEKSWSTGRNSFLSQLKAASNGKVGQYTISFLQNTPLDPSIDTDSDNLYGNLLLGGPPLFNHISDPNNRTTINTFVKDSVFLSLTPGLPKFNGGSFTQSLRSATSSIFSNKPVSTSNYTNQTEGVEEVMNYLLKNGLDPEFAEKDRRYYTFQAKYNQYYSYLETMLNTIWIKLGLGTKNDNSFNLFSFFDPLANSSNYEETLQAKYKSSLGFYVTMSAVSEAISNQEFSSGLEDKANSASDQYQRLNYITGMGSDKVGAMRRMPGVLDLQIETFKSTLNDVKGDGGGLIKSLLQGVKNLATEQDLSALVQAFSVTNGMKVMYPNLWANSNYSKNLNFNFNFVSPYGDPLSIFQYVYVPFFSLLAFALPRQAADNGYISPFFVRADIPGLFTSDLALISDLTWIKGGDTNLWTKDKLPRAISGSFTITDLYPYLSMVKRFSFLSANPSFTVFLDNMAGLGALYGDESESLNKYWKQMINRISGEGNATLTGELWNNFSQNRRTKNNEYIRSKKKKVGRTLNMKSVPWMSKTG